MDERFPCCNQVPITRRWVPPASEAMHQDRGAVCGDKSWQKTYCWGNNPYAWKRKYKQARILECALFRCLCQNIMLKWWSLPDCECNILHVPLWSFLSYALTKNKMYKALFFRNKMFVILGSGGSLVYIFNHNFYWMDSFWKMCVITLLWLLVL